MAALQFAAKLSLLESHFLAIEEVHGRAEVASRLVLGLSKLLRPPRASGFRLRVRVVRISVHAAEAVHRRLFGDWMHERAPVLLSAPDTLRVVAAVRARLFAWRGIAEHSEHALVAENVIHVPSSFGRMSLGIEA